MQKIKGIVKDGKFWPSEKKLWLWILGGFAGQEVEITIKKVTKQRTSLQNRSAHLWHTQVAEAFNEAGLDIKMVLSKDLEHPWNGILVKELIWRKAQTSMYGKRSSKQLTTKEQTEVFEVINRYIGEEFGIHVPWPCIDTLIEQQNEDQKM